MGNAHERKGRAAWTHDRDERRRMPADIEGPPAIDGADAGLPTAVYGLASWPSDAFTPQKRGWPGSPTWRATLCVQGLAPPLAQLMTCCLACGDQWMWGA